MYKYKINSMTNLFDLVNDETMFHVKDPIDTYNNLPIIGNIENDLRMVKDTDKLYAWTKAEPDGELVDWKEISATAIIWGAITGTLSNQTDLKNILDGKSATNHNHNLANLSEKSYNSLTEKPDLSQLHNPVTVGEGISLTGQEVTNIDKGSSAITSHEDLYDHTKIGQILLSNVVYVAKTGGNYTTVSSALTAITDASSINRYTILVMPGIYNEQVTLKNYVDIIGVSPKSVRFEVSLDEGYRIFSGSGVDCIIANITTKGTKKATGVPANFYFSGTCNIIMSNIRVESSATTVYTIEFGAGSINLDLFNCDLQASYGTKFEASTGGTVNAYNCHFNSVDSFALSFGASNFNMYGGRVSGKNGLNLCNSCTGQICLTGVNIEVTTGNAIGFDQAPVGGGGKVFIIGCSIYGRYGIQTYYDSKWSVIRIENCYIRASRNAFHGEGVSEVHNGEIQFDNCRFETEDSVSYYDISSTNSYAKIKLYNCKYKYVNVPIGSLHIISSRQEIIPFINEDTTPSVAKSIIFKTENINSTTITAFDDGVIGQEIIIILGDSNTIIGHLTGDGNIILNGAIDWSPEQNDTLTLIYDGNNWFEKCRSDNTI